MKDFLKNFFINLNQWFFTKKIREEPNQNKVASGVIRDDPALTSGIGQELKFNALTVNHDFKAAAVWLTEWESFEGILLKIHFADDDFHSVEGSGVLVAPGIALCAKHVIEPHLDSLMDGTNGAICTAITSNGLHIWRIGKITIVPNTDLAIVGLVYASELPPNNVFNQAIISTRLPEIGENLLIAGFRASQLKFKKVAENSIKVSGTVLACNGEITAQYSEGRDAVMLPWPSLEVNCPTWGGMSGGPVFDSNGLLIGLLTSAFDDGPSYISLLWPALGTPFEGGWPTSFFSGKKTLFDMAPSLCFIDDPTLVDVGI